MSFGCEKSRSTSALEGCARATRRSAVDQKEKSPTRGTHHSQRRRALSAGSCFHSKTSSSVRSDATPEAVAAAADGADEDDEDDEAAAAAAASAYFICVLKWVKYALLIFLWATH